MDKVRLFATFDLIRVVPSGWITAPNGVTGRAKHPVILCQSVPFTWSEPLGWGTPQEKRYTPAYVIVEFWKPYEEVYIDWDDEPDVFMGRPENKDVFNAYECIPGERYCTHMPWERFTHAYDTLYGTYVREIRPVEIISIKGAFESSMLLPGEDGDWDVVYGNETI